MSTIGINIEGASMGERRKFPIGRLIFLLSVAGFFTYLMVWGITSGYAAKDEIAADTFATNAGDIGDYNIPLALQPNSIYTFKIHAFNDACGAQVVQGFLQLRRDSKLLVEHQWDAQEWNSCDEEGGSATLSQTHIFEFTPLETGSYNITLNITGGSWDLTVYEDLAPLRPDSFDFFMDFFCIGVVGLIVLLYPLVFFFAGYEGIPKFSPKPPFMELAVPGISAALGAMAFFLWTPTYPGSPFMGTLTIILAIPYILYIFVARRKDLARPWITESNKGFVGFIALLTVGIAASFTVLGLIIEFITGGIYFTWFLLPVAIFLACFLLGVWYWMRQRKIRLHLPHGRVPTVGAINAIHSLATIFGLLGLISISSLMGLMWDPVQSIISLALGGCGIVAGYQCLKMGKVPLTQEIPRLEQRRDALKIWMIVGCAWYGMGFPMVIEFVWVRRLILTIKSREVPLGSKLKI